MLDRRLATWGGRGRTYLKGGAGTSTEIGLWSSGAGPLLPCHFHDEVQVCFVLAGRYGYRIGADIVVAGAGQCILIPAHVPHAPLAHDEPGISVLNAYLPAESCTFAGGHVLVFDMVGDGLRDVAEILTIGATETLRLERRLEPTGHGEDVRDLLSQAGSIAALARKLGCSRDGFTRRFRKEIGMPPHAYRSIIRLNQARALLRAGESIAMVAAETGFADQSHLGRQFRRVFGVTPRAYRDAHA
jgi:AraC-like DNA-binding protein/quercetin dioxygenase-like cupin family protein